MPDASLVKGSWRDGADSPVMDILLQYLGEREPILDVGAADRLLGSFLVARGYRGKYFSVDNNELVHDYEEFLAVRDNFQCIIMFELIEHLPLDLGVEYINHAYSLLDKNGLLMMSTPNASHPTQFWRSDVTHIRPWPAADLYGVVRQAGFQETVSIYRQYLHGTSGSLTRRCLRRLTIEPAQKIISRIMDFDFAQNILLIAEK